MSHQIPDVSPNGNDDIYDLTYSKRGCCFWIPCLGTVSSPSGDGSVFWQRINPLDSTPNTPPTAAAATANATSGGAKDPWWNRGWKKLREWSELLAGPKWKTLIRRFNKKRNNYWKQGKFQYDPLSYALNFDEGPAHNRHYDEDTFGRDFSSRYSLPPSAKTSLDFDKEGVTFT